MSGSKKRELDYKEGLVSVVIPVYNAEKYLDKTLRSVLRQTYKNIEVILVDDNSEDGSSEIIKHYQTACQNIIYCLQQKNMGAGYARNKALEMAKGQYIAFLDSDDEWMPDKLERQIDLMREKESPFCYAAIEMIDKDDNIIKPRRNVRENLGYKFLLSNTMIATSSVVIDRKVIGDFRMHLRRGGQDYATWLMLLRDGTLACGINEVLVKYRVREESLSSGKFKSIRQIWEIQTQDEGIGKFSVAWHIIQWCWNSIKKYYM